MFSSVSLELDVMRTTLLKNSPAWEVEQMQKGEKRSFRLIELYDAASLPEGDFNKYARSATERLVSEEFWRDTPQTESMASYVFVSFSRCLAVLHYLVILQCRSYPAKLFSILKYNWRAHEVIQDSQESPCLMDSWTLAHVARHPTVELLLARESLLELSMVCAHCMGNCFNIERAHTKNITKTKHRITHAALLSDICLWPFARAGPEWMDHLCNQGHGGGSDPTIILEAQSPRRIYSLDTIETERERAQSTEHRAQSTEHRAQSREQRAESRERETVGE